ncbi:uncharacterized protein LOC131675295 [Phymastichus coffea]|uniref:uncharacterized protein LOC131675295 n=1 Tax=Phymastichus coffea TaxID=108790 RepID=UPI00273C9FCF|nr:uncharacterized protein LOC131675295 [Phymastichus coffea]
MHKDIKLWCKTCLDCQASKISRHVKNNPAPFVAQDGRFQHVYLDLVGELKPLESFIYCLTMIDRFSRWTEAVPNRDKSAQTVSRAFYDHWMSRFGDPEVVTTDQSSEFEARLNKALLSLIGCRRIRTTAWHSKGNGMIECWHLTVKAVIMCHNDENWVRTRLSILLGLRNHVREETGASPAEHVYGTVLCVPGEFFLEGEFTPDPQIFLEEFREHMHNVRPIPVAHKHKFRAFFFKDLHTCTHAWLLTAAVKKPLERPYTGSHKILERINDLNYKIEVKGTPKVVSTELLKLAHYLAKSNSAPTLASSQRTTANTVLPAIDLHITRSLLV